MLNNYKLLLVLSIAAVLGGLLFGTAGNVLGLGLGMLFVQKKDIRYFPLIVLITAFLSTAYILYIQMFLICLSNFGLFKSKKLQSSMVLYSILAVLFLFFSLKKYLNIDVNLGLAVIDYSFIVALAPFFYGVVLAKNQSIKLDWKKLFNVLIIILVISVLVKTLEPDSTSTRLIFYIIPFLFVQILSNFTSRKAKVITITSALFLFFILDGLTFTLILTGVLSLVLIFKSFISSRAVVVLILLTLFIPYYAVINFDKVDYSKYTDMKMSDVQTFEDLQGRIGMKLFEDRAIIWTSAWINISTHLKMWPTFQKDVLILESSSNKDQEWEQHSHNVYLESALSLGLILGILTTILFLYLNIIAFKAYKMIQLNKFQSAFISVAIVGNLVGAMSGIFPLLLDYSFLSLGLLGVIYGMSRFNKLETKNNITPQGLL